MILEFHEDENAPLVAPDVSNKVPIDSSAGHRWRKMFPITEKWRNVNKSGAELSLSVSEEKVARSGLSRPAGAGRWTSRVRSKIPEKEIKRNRPDYPRKAKNSLDVICNNAAVFPSQFWVETKIKCHYPAVNARFTESTSSQFPPQVLCISPPVSRSRPPNNINLNQIFLSEFITDRNMW